VTVGPSTAWDTIVYAGEALHPTTHRYIHVLGFQNRVINDFHRANAVILPVPATGPLGPENLIEVASLEDQAGPLRQMDPNRSLSVPRVVRGFQLVQKGHYALAWVNRVEDAVHALGTLPEELRPPIDRAALAAHARWYPGWPLVLCCWRGRMQSAPVVLWYEPQNPQRLFLPALEAPAGGVPRPLESAPRDLTLVIGSAIHPFGVAARSKAWLAAELRVFLPPTIWGSVLKGEAPNVDYEVEVAPLRRLENVAGKHDLHPRLDPKLWNVKFEAVNPARR
jgi:hypothetical protein